MINFVLGCPHMLLPILYKRTNTGKIQTWQIETNSDSFRTITGQHEGKMIIHAWTKCKGKNEGKANATAIDQQALKEAHAKWKLKIKEGYTEDINKVNETKLISPMLAESYDPGVELTYPVFVQPKLDGVRLIADNEVLNSRKNTPIVSCPHIATSLAHVFKKYPNIVFDGEAYNHKLKEDFNAIISLVRKTKPTEEDLDESRETIEYWIYDFYDLKDPDITFSARKEKLEELFEEIHDEKIRYSIVMVETIQINNKEELDKAYKDFLEEGFEGMMIRADTPYIHKRTNNLLKRKEFITEEYEILGMEEGEGDRAGGAGKLVFSRDGKRFEANIVGGFALYRHILANPKEYIGRQATVKYQNLTPAGVPRFGRVIRIYPKEGRDL